MRPNRKARNERKLNYQETQRKRLAVLLTEMERAASEVLQADFEFSQAEVDSFLESVRAEMKAEPVEIKYNPLHPNRHLATTAQRFGLVGAQVLKETHEFTAEQLDDWLAGLVAAGARSRV